MNRTHHQYPSSRETLEPRIQFGLREAFNTNVVMLITHVALLLTFFFLDVWLMVAINICSVATYLLLFALLKSDHTHWFMPILQTEVLIHMTFAVVCLGWDYGFQLYTFSLVATAFYSGYLERKVELYRPHALLLVIGIAALFVFLRIFTLYFQPLYAISLSGLDIGFFCANAAITFSLMIYYLVQFDRVIAHAEEDLQDMAERDELTALSNRRHMMDIAQGVFDHADESNAEVAVALLDVDDFKLTNDRYGHDAGDYVLRTLGHGMSVMESEGLQVGRWGGEEFLVVNSGEEAYDRLRTHLQDLIKKTAGFRFSFNNTSIPTSVTCGVVKRRDGENIDQTFKRADSLMYIGKARGKNCLVDEQNNRPLNPRNADAD